VKRCAACRGTKDAACFHVGSKVCVRCERDALHAPAADAVTIPLAHGRELRVRRVHDLVCLVQGVRLAPATPPAVTPLGVVRLPYVKLRALRDALDALL
jgi:hypothetical protein